MKHRNVTDSRKCGWRLREWDESEKELHERLRFVDLNWEWNDSVSETICELREWERHSWASRVIEGLWEISIRWFKLRMERFSDWKDSWGWLSLRLRTEDGEWVCDEASWVIRVSEWELKEIWFFFFWWKEFWCCIARVRWKRDFTTVDTWPYVKYVNPIGPRKQTTPKKS
jgi:hypothetical protein